MIEWSKPIRYFHHIAMWPSSALFLNPFGILGMKPREKGDQQRSKYTKDTKVTNFDLINNINKNALIWTGNP